MLSSVLFGQERSNSYIIKGNLIFPQGDFLDDDIIAEDGFASIGYGVGLEYQHIIGPEGLGIFISGDILVNPIDEERVKQVLVGGYEYKFKDPYINIPLMAGLLYTVQINPNTDFQLKAGGGINYYIPPDYEIIHPFPDTTNISNASVNTFGFRIAGTLIIDKVLIEISYLNLGEAEFEAQSYQPFFTPTLENLKQRISMVNFTVGIRF
jgi:hypothetical protein